MPDYADTIGDTVMKKLKENLPNDFFKIYFYGDPFEIPVSSLPCIIIEKDAARITHGPTGMDLANHEVNIILAINARTEWGKSSSEVIGKKILENTAEGRDASTGGYHDKSVVGILRKNFTLGNVITDQDIVIEYGVTPRPGEASITRECRIRCLIEELIEVPTRT